MSFLTPTSYLLRTRFEFRPHYATQIRTWYEHGTKMVRSRYESEYPHVPPQGDSDTFFIIKKISNAQAVENFL